ncbi:MAG: universal stress protein [Chloroflexota bacterium]|nr:universal stress protein [Dehalococcoidia bacterium]MDW8253028.1 universal stress protein [Chloroflexota bacterium]
MYDPIMLTLDGSELAERAIPHAVAMAKQFGARLIVVRVVPPVVQPLDVDYGMSTPYGYEKLIEAEVEGANAYLADVVKAIEAEGLTVETVTPLGEPATAILDTAQERGAGLIVMATHGRGGFQRLVFGSVADRVLREAEVPVLLIRAHDRDQSPSEKS